MIQKKLSINVSIILLFLIIISGCRIDQTSEAAQAAEQYYQALVKKDENAMINLSCSDWEADTKLMYDSFAAVELTLDNLSCQQTPKDEDFIVSCTGNLIASYGAEKLEIDIAERPLVVIEEGGEWRVCGYHGE